MDTVICRTVTAACFALFTAAAHAQSEASRPAQAQAAVALTGQVGSAEEGAMEGVVVSARKDGSTISISVVTDAQGRFAFPAARLEPGHYALKARAAGYEIDAAQAADVAAGSVASADIKLIACSARLQRVMPRLQSRGRKSKAALRIGHHTDADGRAVFLRADNHAFHRPFFGGSDLPDQR